MRENGRSPDHKGDWKELFLQSLRRFGIVHLACKYAGITRKYAYIEKKQNPEFAEAWKDAEEDAIDLLEAIANKRAREISDKLLMFLLTNKRYKKLITHEHKGTIGVETSKKKAAIDLEKLTIAERNELKRLLELARTGSRPDHIIEPKD